MAKPAKVQAVEEIKEHFQNSATAVVTEYRGLSVQIGRASCRERVSFLV